MEDLPRVSWKNIMCTNIARPKAIFITWLQLQDRLLTAKRLQKWGQQVDITCHLCKKEEETSEHLFAECEFRNRLWSTLMSWIKSGWQKVKTWRQMQDWIKQKMKEKTKQARLMKLIYAEFDG